jgi:hypothetical protein
MHEENPMTGMRNYTESDARMMYQWVKELNANFVRLAHYPHNDYMAPDCRRTWDTALGGNSGLLDDRMGKFRNA